MRGLLLYRRGRIERSGSPCFVVTCGRGESRGRTYNGSRRRESLFGRDRHGLRDERAVALTQHIAKLGPAYANCIRQHGMEDTGSRSPGELVMTRSTSDDAACRSSASVRCFRSELRLGASSCFLNSTVNWAVVTRFPVFVPANEDCARSAFRALARQGHLVGTVTGPLPDRASQDRARQS